MTDPVYVLIVPGTWADDDVDPYYGPNGALVRFLERRAWVVLDRGDPGWSCDLEGTIIEKLIGRARRGWHSDWSSGGNYIRLKLAQLAPAVRRRLVIICHSHGLQVVLYALAKDSAPEVFGLISVASPDRSDMRAAQKKARRKLARWTHLQMGGRDNMSWLGTIGSGSLGDTLGGMIGWSLGPPSADRRLKLVDYDHGEVLRDPERYSFWPEVLDDMTPPTLLLDDMTRPRRTPSA